MFKKYKIQGVVLVLIFLITLIWWGSVKADTLTEIGPSQIADNFSSGVMLTLSERVNDRYDFTVGYISEQVFKACERPDCRWDIRSQIFVGTELLITSPWTDKLRLGLGPYYFQNADRVGTTNFRMGLSVEYRFNRRFGFRARHFSTAGSGPDIEICRPDFGCLTNDWNTGQDSWARLVWYF